MIIISIITLLYNYDIRYENRENRENMSLYTFCLENTRNYLKIIQEIYLYYVFGLDFSTKHVFIIFVYFYCSKTLTKCSIGD